MSFQSSFSSTCSLPSTPTHFVSSPNTRGTLNILWTSLSTLILCTWTIQHLSIPPVSRSRTRAEKLRKLWSEMIHKVFWMLLTLIAPEVLAGKALVDLVSARRSREAMKKWSEKDGVEWGLVHGFWANMGGFIVDFKPGIGNGVEEQKCKWERRIESGDGSEEEDEGISTRVKTSTTPSASVMPNSSLQSEAIALRVAKKSSNRKNSAIPSPGCPKKHMSNLSATPTQGHLPLIQPTCPCQKSKSEDRPYSYMSLADIIAHQTSFWNGRFHVFPPRVKLGYTPALDPEQALSTPNQEIASQMIYEVGIRPSAKAFDLSFALHNYICFSGNEWTLDAHQLLLARDLGIISSLPVYTTEELEAQSKSDILLKLISILSVLYVILQLLLRHLQSLPSSQLEVLVIAFSASAATTYAFYLSKPKDVQIPHHITAVRYPTPSEINEFAEAGPLRFIQGGYNRLLPAFEMRNMRVHNCGSSTRLQDSGQTFSVKIFAFGALVGSSIFGGLHCLAWDFDFPTEIEKVLWRVSSVVTVAAPMAGLALVYGREARGMLVGLVRGRNWGDFKARGHPPIMVATALSSMQVAYLGARIFTFVEVFRSLFYLKPDTFLQTNWGV